MKMQDTVVVVVQVLDDTRAAGALSLVQASHPARQQLSFEVTAERVDGHAVMGGREEERRVSTEVQMREDRAKAEKGEKKEKRAHGQRRRGSKRGGNALDMHESAVLSKGKQQERKRRRSASLAFEREREMGRTDPRPPTLQSHTAPPLRRRAPV
jgi:hypothetical protein